MSDIKTLVAAAIHEVIESVYPVTGVHCDHDAPFAAGGLCVSNAGEILATPSGQAIVARIGALEAALRDLIDEGADGYILDTSAYFRACDLFEPPEDTSQADLLDAVDRGEVPVAVARRRLGLAPREAGAGRMTPCDCGVLHAAWAGDVIVDDPDDEIRAHRAVVHIERMSGHGIYIGIHTPDGRYVQVSLVSRSRIRMLVERTG